MQNNKNGLIKFTVELPMGYLNKVSEICDYRFSNQLTGRFKRQVVMDAIDILYHCHKNNDLVID